MTQRKGSSRAARRRLVLPLALLAAVVLAFPTAALAGATGETGYGTTAPPPKTTPTPTTTPTTTPTSTTKTPSSGTSPAKEESAPANTPAKETAPAKSSAAKTLPFTGFDLRWTVGIGLLLVGIGFSIVTVQRRQRRDG